MAQEIINKKRFVITNAQKTERMLYHSNLTSTIVADGDDDMEASDGSHTFTELYQHRIALFIALCKRVKEDFEKRPTQPVWRSKLHSDGSSYDNWFILGIFKGKGSQITYHVPMALWEETDFAETLGNAPEWDGHSPADVLKRIKNI